MAPPILRREPGGAPLAEARIVMRSPLLPDNDFGSAAAPVALDTRTAPQPATPLEARQSSSTLTTVPSTYGAMYSSPDPGTVVGITLGAVGGFIVVLWIIYTIVNLGNDSSAESYGTASVVSSRRSRAHRRRHHHREREVETVEVRRGGASRGPVIVEAATVTSSVPPPRRASGGERIVLEETTRRVSSRSRGGPPPRVVVDDDDSGGSDDDDDDEVVVIEEHSPPRRRSKRRSRSPSRRESGYRDVDPDRFGGGDGPVRSVRRESGSRRR